eukprot:2508471-Rhodomonas_salina.1
MTANVCGIGVSTAKSDTKQLAGAIIAHAKPLYLPGKPDKDRLEHNKRKFAERRNIGNVAMTVDGTH